MNSHQRRKDSRRRHMEFPLKAAVQLRPLLGRKVYAYGRVSDYIPIHADNIGSIVEARINRHVRCGYGGQVDLLLLSVNGEEQTICTSLKGLRLLNPADKAARPWWVEMLKSARRKAQGASTNKRFRANLRCQLSW